MPIDDKVRQAAQMAVSRAKIAMLETHPFYAYILTKLKFEFVEELPHNAPSATDGLHVYIVPDRYLAATKQEQLSMLAHEQLHCLDGHLWRRGDRDPLIANIAQDIYIFHVLRDESFTVLRKNQEALTGALKQLAGGRFTLDDFKGQFWEQIYQTLAPLNPPQPQGSSGAGGDAGNGDDEGDGECGHCYLPPKSQDGASSAEQAKANAEQWKQWVREAGTYAKVAGCKPGSWQQWVEAATPRVPFETRFVEHLKRGLGGDQQYESFNRRYLSRGEYMPSEVVEQMCETVGVVDTSGSVPTADIAYAIGVFRNWRDAHPCKFHLIECDAAVQQFHSYDEFEEIPSQFNVKGRGGTIFSPPFEAVDERHLEPGLLIYITDGYNSGDFAPQPAYNVLWVLAGEFNKDFHPPYGSICTVDRDMSTNSTTIGSRSVTSTTGKRW